MASLHQPVCFCAQRASYLPTLAAVSLCRLISHSVCERRRFIDVTMLNLTETWTCVDNFCVTCGRKSPDSLKKKLNLVSCWIWRNSPKHSLSVLIYLGLLVNSAKVIHDVSRLPQEIAQFCELLRLEKFINFETLSMTNSKLFKPSDKFCIKCKNMKLFVSL